MTRNKTRSIPPSNTSHLFDGRNKGNDRGAAVTSERIASDIEEFNKAGGHIEVLGVTKALKKIDGGGDHAPPQPASAGASSRRRMS
jgi:hypothetical protein